MATELPKLKNLNATEAVEVLNLLRGKIAGNGSTLLYFDLQGKVAIVVKYIAEFFGIVFPVHIKQWKKSQLTSELIRYAAIRYKRGRSTGIMLYRLDDMYWQPWPSPNRVVVRLPVVPPIPYIMIGPVPAVPQVSSIPFVPTLPPVETLRVVEEAIPSLSQADTFAPGVPTEIDQNAPISWILSGYAAQVALLDDPDRQRARMRHDDPPGFAPNEWQYPAVQLDELPFELPKMPLLAVAPNEWPFDAIQPEEPVPYRPQFPGDSAQNMDIDS